MPSPLPESEIFIRNIRRRMVFRSLLDRAGFVVFSASLSAICVLPFAIWGHVAMAFVFAAICSITLVVAVPSCVRRWPTRTLAAALADRQLGLDDLLTTTVKIQPVPFDDLSAVVMGIANTRCRVLAPTDVSVSGFSAKSWMGIVLATAVAGAMATLAVQWSNSPQAEPESSLLASAIDPPAATTLTPPNSMLHSLHPDPGNDDESQMSAPMDHNDPAHSTSADSANQNRPPGNDAGAGGGASATHARAAVPQSDSATADGNRATKTGTTSSNGIESTHTPDGSEAASGSTVAHNTQPAAVPAWRSTDWTTARAAAMSSVQAGAIPSAYRDLVRDYFH